MTCLTRVALQHVTHNYVFLDCYGNNDGVNICASYSGLPSCRPVAIHANRSGSMFEPNGVALDIFGDKETSDARRRCQPADGDEDGAVLFNMHLGVAGLYMAAYVGSEHMPWCTDIVSALMETYGAPLSMLDVADASTDTPWGLAKAYIDEVMSFLMENDGWNAGGGLGGQEFNRIPFTGDFSYVDSAGNE